MNKSIIILILLFLIYFYICNFVVFPLNAGSIIKRPILNSKNDVSIPPTPIDLVAVIVEPRPDNLVETIKIYMEILPKNTHFQIYHGINNKRLLEETFENEIRDHKIFLINLYVDNLNIQSYSDLLTSIDFWKSIKSENVLIFQTDSTPCRNSSFKIEDFMEYDFIGAPVNTTINNFLHFYFLPKGYYVNYKNFMNGGLSFRKKSSMIKALQKYPWDGKMTEDVWLCMALYKLGGKLPTKEEARKFSFESERLEAIPWGIHKPRKEIDKLNKICPEVKNIQTIESHKDYRNLFLL